MSIVIRKPKLMEFVNYEIVRRSGKFNMITDMESAAKEAGLSIDQYKNVIDNYQWCLDQWKNCKFRIKEWYKSKNVTWNYKYVTSDSGEIVHYCDLYYAIDDLARVRSKFTESDWELEKVH